MIRIKSRATTATEFIKAVMIASTGGVCGERSNASADSPMPGWMFPSAVMRYLQKQDGSLSLSSNEIQATGQDEQAAHSLRAVVLPAPAGAETSINLCWTAASRRSFNN